MTACPCCGSPMPSPPPADELKTLELGRTERELLGYYVESYPRALHTERVVSRLWQFDPNGGPGDPRNGICQRVFRINRALRPMGWHLRRVGMDERLLEKVSTSRTG